MYDPTLWQKIKDTFRYWLCRHKHTEIRTVTIGKGSDREKKNRFTYCLDCQNNISGWMD